MGPGDCAGFIFLCCPNRGAKKNPLSGTGEAQPGALGCSVRKAICTMTGRNSGLIFPPQKGTVHCMSGNFLSAGTVCPGSADLSSALLLSATSHPAKSCHLSADPNHPAGDFPGFPLRGQFRKIKPHSPPGPSSRARGAYSSGRLPHCDPYKNDPHAGRHGDLIVCW